MASRAPGPRSTSGFPAEDGPLFVGLTAVRGSSLDASTDPTAKRHLYFYSSRSENTSGSPGQTNRILPACLHPGFLDARRVLHPGLGFGAQPSPSLHREATGQCLATSRGRSREGARLPAHPTPGRLSKPVGSSEIRLCLRFSAAWLFLLKPLTAKGTTSSSPSCSAGTFCCRCRVWRKREGKRRVRGVAACKKHPPGRVERRLGTGWWQRQGLC